MLRVDAPEWTPGASLQQLQLSGGSHGDANTEQVDKDDLDKLFQARLQSLGLANGISSKKPVHVKEQSGQTAATQKSQLEETLKAKAMQSIADAKERQGQDALDLALQERVKAILPNARLRGEAMKHEETATDTANSSDYAADWASSATAVGTTSGLQVNAPSFVPSGSPWAAATLSSSPVDAAESHLSTTPVVNKSSSSHDLCWNYEGIGCAAGVTCRWRHGESETRDDAESRRSHYLSTLRIGPSAYSTREVPLSTSPVADARTREAIEAWAASAPPPGYTGAKSLDSTALHSSPVWTPQKLATGGKTEWSAEAVGLPTPEKLPGPVAAAYDASGWQFGLSGLRQANSWAPSEKPEQQEVPAAGGYGGRCVGDDLIAKLLSGQPQQQLQVAQVEVVEELGLKRSKLPPPPAASPPPPPGFAPQLPLAACGVLASVEGEQGATQEEAGFEFMSDPGDDDLDDTLGTPEVEQEEDVSVEMNEPEVAKVAVQKESVLMMGQQPAPLPTPLRNSGVTTCNQAQQKQPQQKAKLPPSWADIVKKKDSKLKPLSQSLDISVQGAAPRH